MKTDAFPVHKIDDSQIELLKNLCAALAVSGDEGEVRKLILQAISPFTDECRVDALGNVLAVRKAKVADPMRVMLAAHMDEVGFMIVNEDEAGIYRFEVIGGINERYLPGKHVVVGKDHIPGVIGIFPIHLSEEGAEAKGITSRELRIDIGLDAEGKVKPGDKASFATRFEVMGGSISDRALDNRLGVAILISLIKHAPPHLELHAAFTVQQEIGLRGAVVAPYAINPHVPL